jgi:hypothetical protein
MTPSKALGAQQGVGEVEQEAERDEAGERVIEDHRSLLLKPFADIGVADTGREQAEGDREHENVEHGMFQCAVPAGRIDGTLHSRAEVPASA